MPHTVLKGKTVDLVFWSAVLVMSSATGFTGPPRPVQR